jgi:hypothetical protein
VKVSQGTLDRALRVLAQVVATLERQGFTVGVSDQDRTAALIKGERVSFGVEGANSETRDREAASDQSNRSLGLRRSRYASALGKVGAPDSFGNLGPTRTTNEME